MKTKKEKLTLTKLNKTVEALQKFLNEDHTKLHNLRVNLTYIKELKNEQLNSLLKRGTKLENKLKNKRLWFITRWITCRRLRINTKMTNAFRADNKAFLDINLINAPRNLDADSFWEKPFYEGFYTPFCREEWNA